MNVSLKTLHKQQKQNLPKLVKKKGSVGNRWAAGFGTGIQVAPKAHRSPGQALGPAARLPVNLLFCLDSLPPGLENRSWAQPLGQD